MQILLLTSVAGLEFSHRPGAVVDWPDTAEAKRMIAGGNAREPSPGEILIAAEKKAAADAAKKAEAAADKKIADAAKRKAKPPAKKKTKKQHAAEEKAAEEKAAEDAAGDPPDPAPTLNK